MSIFETTVFSISIFSLIIFAISIGDLFKIFASLKQGKETSPFFLSFGVSRKLAMFSLFRFIMFWLFVSLSPAMLWLLVSLSLVMLWLLVSLTSLAMLWLAIFKSFDFFIELIINSDISFLKSILISQLI